MQMLPIRLRLQDMCRITAPATWERSCHRLSTLQNQLHSFRLGQLPQLGRISRIRVTNPPYTSNNFSIPMQKALPFARPRVLTTHHQSQSPEADSISCQLARHLTHPRCRVIITALHPRDKIGLEYKVCGAAPETHRWTKHEGLVHQESVARYPIADNTNHQR